MADNIIRPSQKRTWGFSGTADNIQMTSDLAKQAEDVLQTPTTEGNKNNGGGEPSQFPGEDEVTAEYLDSLTKENLLALAAAHEVELEKKDGKKAEVLAELKEYYEV